MVEIDTSKISSCGTDIVKLSQDLGTIFDDIFSEMSNLIVNGAWSGNAASEFVSKVSGEKVYYTNFQKNLYNYGIALKNNADSFSNVENEIE